MSVFRSVSKWKVVSSSCCRGVLPEVGFPWLIGILWVVLGQELPSLGWHWTTLPLLYLLGRYQRLAAVLFWLFLGLLWATVVAQQRLDARLPEPLAGKDLQLVGRVVSLPLQRADGSWRFRLALEQATMAGNPLALQGVVRLNWYHHTESVAVGERWQLQVRLKPPHGFFNPAGMDWEQWLFQQQIVATGYVRNSTDNHRLEEAIGGVDQLRQQLRQWILDEVGDSPQYGIVVALVIGARSDIPPEYWEVLRWSGTSHLVAISGLHVGLVAALGYGLFRGIGLFWPGLLLWLPAQRLGAIGGILAATGYAALAGFTIPTQRALVMVLVALGLVLLGRMTDRWSGYGIALLVVLLIDPFAVLAAGFWLSFGAVGWILYALPIAQGWRRLPALLYLQAVLLLGLLPLQLYLFQQGALVAPVANLIAVPWIGMGVVPLALLAALLQLLHLPGGGGLLDLAVWQLELLWPLLEGLAEIPWLQFQSHRPPLWSVIFALLSLLLLLYPRAGRSRWWGVVGVVPLLLWPPDRPAPGEARVTVLDVGQGLAVVVESHRRVLLYDAGDRFSPTFNGGSAVVLPYLRQQGWSHIDLLVVSHDDRDHIGGVAPLLAEIPALDRVSAVPEALPGARYCEAGERWEWDGVVIELIHPPTTGLFRGNDRSCVLRIEAAGESLLLTGDIERAAEEELWKRWPLQIDVDGVVVPHHGSGTSSTPQWIDATSPRWAIIPAGYLNRYRLPRAEVVERYHRRGIELYNTAIDGAVQVELDGVQRFPTGWRRQWYRFWSHRPESYGKR